MAGLTPRQQRFVDEYLIDLNATQAAIRAGYSARTAQEQSSRLLSNVMVAQAVETAKAERAIKLGLTADRVLEELAALGYAKLGDYAEWGAERFTLLDSDAVDTRAVQEIKVKETVLAGGEDGPTILKREYGVKLHDKVGTLKLLGQHLGMFSEKHEVTGKGGGPIEVKPDGDAMAKVIEAAEQAAIKAIYGTGKSDGDSDA